jgi:DNA-binding HxlR family transcriptional regulator
MLKKEFSVYSIQCPSHNVLEGISDKWSILIIGFLNQKTCRFGELKREVGGISPKVLTSTLQKLEKYGFVSREAFPVLPLKVEYSLTSLGKELSLILNTLTTWTENNMKEILLAEKNFSNKESIKL